MATSNFLQWNPTAANQDSDAAYSADTLRSGGAVNGAFFDATLANKVFFQASTMASAIAEFMVAQGQNAQDSNLATLVADLTAAIVAIITATAVRTLSVNATPVTVNANTSSSQTMMTASFGAGYFNASVGKTVRLTAHGILSVASAEAVGFTINGGAISFANLGQFSSASLGSNMPWKCEIDISTITTGSSGSLVISSAMTFGGGIAISVGPISTYETIITGIDLTAAITVPIGIGFGSPSTSNSATENVLIVEALN